MLKKKINKINKAKIITKISIFYIKIKEKRNIVKQQKALGKTLVKVRQVGSKSSPINKAFNLAAKTKATIYNHILILYLLY
jgi:hypothetical protein